MKNALLALCLVISAGSAAYAAWLHQRFEARLAVSADEALARREAEIVALVMPHFLQMFRDMGRPLPETTPRRVEELMAPLLEIIESISDVGDGDE